MLFPSYEYAKKRILEEVGIKDFLKNTFYLFAPSVPLMMSMRTIPHSEFLSNSSTNLFSVELLSDIGRSLYYAGGILWSWSFAHLYSSQIASVLTNIKDGIRRTGTNVVTHLEYSLTRNPIYLGMRAMSLGCLLYRPTLENAASCALVFLTTELTARGEEKYLEMMWGERFKEYERKVPRWIPRPKRIIEIIKKSSVLKREFNEDINYSLLSRKKLEMPKEDFERLLEKVRKIDPFVPNI
jgi:protein-S-isoprenylcysteine O-methyltransferase Ste14